MHHSYATLVGPFPLRVRGEEEDSSRKYEIENRDSRSALCAPEAPDAVLVQLPLPAQSDRARTCGRLKKVSNVLPVAIRAPVSRARPDRVLRRRRRRRAARRAVRAVPRALALPQVPRVLLHRLRADRRLRLTARAAQRQQLIQAAQQEDPPRPGRSLTLRAQRRTWPARS